MILLAVAVTSCGTPEDTSGLPTLDPKIVATTFATGVIQPPTPTPSVAPAKHAAWKTRYTSRQLHGYRAALAAWRAYEAAAEPIWAHGKATPAAKRLFQESFPFPAWMGQWHTLQAYQQVDIMIKGLPHIYWSRPTQISDTGRSVTITQCVNWTPVKGTQYGKPAIKTDWDGTPQRREIHLSKPDGYGWLIYTLSEGGEKSRPCTP